MRLPLPKAVPHPKASPPLHQSSIYQSCQPQTQRQHQHQHQHQDQIQHPLQQQQYHLHQQATPAPTRHHQQQAPRSPYLVQVNAAVYQPPIPSPTLLESRQPTKVTITSVAKNTTQKSDSMSSNGASRIDSETHWMPRSGKTNIKSFFTACQKGNLEAVRWHLLQNAKVMEPYESMSGRTPLHAAAMSDSFEVMKLLCESAGTALNMNEQDDNSQTPLHLLTQYGRNSHDLLVYMLEMGANPNAQDSERRTPLMTTFIMNDNPELVETLLDYGADPDLRCQENNALAEAAIHVRYLCVKVLLETDLR